MARRFLAEKPRTRQEAPGSGSQGFKTNSQCIHRTSIGLGALGGFAARPTPYLTRWTRRTTNWLARKPNCARGARSACLNRLKSGKNRPNGQQSAKRSAVNDSTPQGKRKAEERDKQGNSEWTPSGQKRGGTHMRRRQNRARK